MRLKVSWPEYSRFLDEPKHIADTVISHERFTKRRQFHLLLAFLLFPTNWGICFWFKANSKGLNLTHECSVRAG